MFTVKLPKNYLWGILSAVIITILSLFVVNFRISFSSTDTSYIDVYRAVPHYEFSNEDTYYVEYLDITYKIKPPFYPFSFNSVQEIYEPYGYMIRKMPPYDDCVAWNRGIGALTITAITSQFKVSECSTTLEYEKILKKNELVDIYFNSSWRKDYENNTFYEEEGIDIKNKFNKLVKNYIFVYNQSNISQISWNFKNCSTLETFINQKEVDNRHNFFGNSSILAIKFDLSPRETKEVIVRCYH